MVRCALIVVCCVLYALRCVCCLLLGVVMHVLVGRCSLFAVRYVLLIVKWLLFVVCCLWCYCALFDVRCLLNVVCWLSVVVCCSMPVFVVFVVC